MDLIEPRSKDEVVDALSAASERGTRVSIMGGRTHADKGNPSDIDAEVAMSGLDRRVAYDPAEMLAVVEAGMRIGDLRRILAEGGQEWPADASDDATVGGTIATAPSSPRRLRMRPLRDSVVEIELVTGAGRLVRSGARTVKSVAGYDVHRLATGSLGTLGAIVQVAVKVRPLPKSLRVVRTSEGGLLAGRRLLEAVPLASAVVATPERVEVALEGWPQEIEEQTSAITRAAGNVEVLESESLGGSEAVAGTTVVEVAVPPSRSTDGSRPRSTRPGSSRRAGSGEVCRQEAPGTTEESASRDRYGPWFCRLTLRSLDLANSTRSEPSEALARLLQGLQLLAEREADEMGAELRA